MRPPESFLGQPVRSLQTMLRVIAEADRTQPGVIPDGIYGNNTVTAVSEFQRKKGLPVTGITDEATWDAIYLEYESALILVDEAQPIQVIWEPNQIVRRGERHPNVYLAQGMLTVLSDVYSSILPPELSGELDLPTVESIRSFQDLNQLPSTGELDRITWFQLAKQYPLASRLAVKPISETNSENNSQILLSFQNFST